MTDFGSCALCGEEILEADTRDLHDQIVSWYLRRRGTGQPIRGKYPRLTGAVAHGHCAEDAHRKQKAGIPVKQLGLF
jgi:hypothetical protein